MSQNGFDIYQIENISGENIQIEISFIIAPLDIAILDTSFDYSVIWSLITKFDPIHNPHLLADTYTEGGLNNTIKNLSYLSSQSSLFLLIYSLDRMYEDTPQNVSYELTTSHKVVETELDNNYESHLPFGVQGTIDEDADNKWDNEEYYFISITIQEGEILDLLLASEVDNIFVMVFDGDDETDIDTSINEVINNFEQGQGYPSNVYIFTQSIGGIGYGSYLASTTINANIAVFSYSDYSFTSDFVVRTSLPTVYDQDGDENNNNNLNETDSNNPFVTVLIFLIIITGGYLFYRYYKNSQMKRHVNRYNYQQYQRSQQYRQDYSEYQEEFKQKPLNSQNVIYCYNCGTKNAGRFCINCGRDLQS